LPFSCEFGQAAAMPRLRTDPWMPLGEFARRMVVGTLIVLAIYYASKGLWRIKELLALLFIAFTLAAAMRPGIEWLHGRRIPRGVGVLLHYLAILAFVLLLLWLVVPRAVHQVDLAVNGNAIAHQAKTSTGVKHDILVAIQKRLNHLPKAGTLVHKGVGIGRAALDILIGALFVFAAAAYWIFEREAAVDMVADLVPRTNRKKLRDTWHLIDLKLGAYVRGQLFLISIVATCLSVAFFFVNEPYWLLVGVFAGLVEIIPVVGPLTAGATAVGVGLTASVHVAVLAGLCVFGMRMAQDYVIVPRVMGNVVGISPLVVLSAALTMTLLFGGAAVVLAVPLAAVIVTLVDVIVRDKDPAEEEVPTVIFTSED
jgi:predicted PurR-regulated permease PerM